MKDKLKRVGNFVKEFIDGKTVDPASFGDPLALETDWTELRMGGVRFASHKLVQLSPNTLRFRPTIGIYIKNLLFFLLGAGLISLVFGISYLLEEEIKWDFPVIMIVSLGLIAIGRSVFQIYRVSIPIWFDTAKGYFWKGRVKPDHLIDISGNKQLVALKEIHAFQILRKYVGGRNSFTCYELNLVLKDGRRENVIDHSNLNRIRRDAETLSRFLGKPVWDAV